jgi:hypothetical protein
VSHQFPVEVVVTLMAVTEVVVDVIPDVAGTVVTVVV